jgi:iron(III) transport system substrate-binding protein
MNFHSFKIAAASLAAGLLLAGAGAARADGKVVLYCPAPGEWCQNVANDFKRSTGINVDVLRRSAGEILAQLRAESARPRGDLWWGGISDSHFVAAAEGLTIPYDTKAVEELAPWAQSVYKASNKHAIGTYGERRRQDFFVRHLLGVEPPNRNADTELTGEVTSQTSSF